MKVTQRWRARSCPGSAGILPALFAAPGAFRFTEGPAGCQRSQGLANPAAMAHVFLIPSARAMLKRVADSPIHVSKSGRSRERATRRFLYCFFRNVCQHENRDDRARFSSPARCRRAGEGPSRRCFEVNARAVVARRWGWRCERLSAAVSRAARHPLRPRLRRGHFPRHAFGAQGKKNRAARRGRTDALAPVNAWHAR